MLRIIKFTKKINMKKQSLLILALAVQLFSASAQIFPFNDDFESYTAFNVPTGYAGNITVYLTHGTAQSKGLGGFLTSFSNKDSLISPLIGPVSGAAVLEFDWRIMDPFLYPSTPATLANGDNFDIFASSDGISWTSLFNINNLNYVSTTNFVHETIGLSSFAGQNIQLKIQGLRANGSAEFFIDIDNIIVDLPSKIEPNELKSFSIYPTPANNLLFFSNSVPLKGTVEIIDISGKIVLQRVLKMEASGQIDISSIASGNYLLKVNTAEGNKISPLPIR